MAAVAVLGSLNHDLTVTLPRFPRPDETLRAHGLASYAGGKGFNQAIAAARLGATVGLVGAVGTDAAAGMLGAALAADGVDASHVRTAPGPTGTAIPLVTDEGEVAIVIVAGANGTVGVHDAERAAALITAADVLLLQGEVPVAASVRAAELARAAGTVVVWNPAPVPDGIGEHLGLADVLLVNRREAEALGVDGRAGVVVTLGPGGASVDGDVVPAFPVERVVDPTGAGDAFAAAVAVALAEGRPLRDAVRFGNAAGALAVGVAGAEPSLPRRPAVESLLRGEATVVHWDRW